MRFMLDSWVDPHRSMSAHGRANFYSDCHQSGLEISIIKKSSWNIG